MKYLVLFRLLSGCEAGVSELRHLHFELVTKRVPFDTTASSQVFNFIYNPELLFK